MKYLAVLLLGMLLGALVYRELEVRRSPALASPADCASACRPPAAAGPTQGAASSVAAVPAEPPPRPEPSSAAPVPATTEPAQPASARIAVDADAAPVGLLIPVEGKTASELTDTFADARSQGRSHDAIDIMAPAGTPVLAVADGHIEKLFDSKPGGLTVYQFEPSGKYAYYYAHLQRYAQGLAEKQAVRRGQVIGYVGSTGNASPEAPHLHFAVFLLGPEQRWWEGTAINPYPALTGRPVGQGQ